MNVFLIKPTQLDEKGEPIYMKKALFPPISLATVAALLPKDYQIKIIDETIEKINFDEKADLVGFYALTCTINRANYLAQEFRRRNVKTIIGGPHASTFPQECANYFDAIFIGEAEDTIPEFIQDFKNGQIKKIYQTDKKPDLGKSPIPRFDLFNWQKYSGVLGQILVSIQTSRGCPFDCDFCVAKLIYKHGINLKPVDKVIAEIESVNSKYFFLCDDNLMVNIQHCRELLEALIPLKKIFFVQLSANIVNYPDLIELAGKAGVRLAFLGIESISTESLEEINKTQNKVQEYKKLFKLLLKNNIIPIPSFMLALKNDTREIFDDIINFLNDAPSNLPLFFIFAPPPGSKSYEKYLENGLIADKNMDLYDGTHVVIRHKNLTKEQIYAGYWKCYERIYGTWPIIKRTFKFLLTNPTLENLYFFTSYNLYDWYMTRKRIHPFSGGVPIKHTKEN